MVGLLFFKEKIGRVVRLVKFWKFLRLFLVMFLRLKIVFEVKNYSWGGMLEIGLEFG